MLRNGEPPRPTHRHNSRQPTGERRPRHVADSPPEAVRARSSRASRSPREGRPSYPSSFDDRASVAGAIHGWWRNATAGGRSEG